MNKNIEFAKKYGFSKYSAGDIFRKIASERGVDILELNRLNDTSIDHLVDDEIVKVGTENIDKNMIFDSRTAWHFVPKSFKVFIDVQVMNKQDVLLIQEETLKKLTFRLTMQSHRLMKDGNLKIRDICQFMGLITKI